MLPSKVTFCNLVVKRIKSDEAAAPCDTQQRAALEGGRKRDMTREACVGRTAKQAAAHIKHNAINTELPSAAG